MPIGAFLVYYDFNSELDAITIFRRTNNIDNLN